MKSTIVLILAVFLFGSTVLADDGNMGNGNKTCPTGQTCSFSGQTVESEEETADSDDTILIIVQEYLDSLINYFES